MQVSKRILDACIYTAQRFYGRLIEKFRAPRKRLKFVPGISWYFGENSRDLLLILTFLLTLCVNLYAFSLKGGDENTNYTISRCCSEEVLVEGLCHL